MPAELDTREDGSAAMIYREGGGTPWHREGHPITGDALRDLDGALEEAGLRFEVEKVPHMALTPAGMAYLAEVSDAGLEPTSLKLGEHVVRSKDAWSVIRTDRNDVVGTVGSTWKPLQNVDAFEPIRPVLDADLARIETAGSLRRGANVWMLVRFDTEEILRRVDERIRGEGFDREPRMDDVEGLFEEVLPYALFMNDHSGSGKARVKETGVRVVCSNTLDWSLGRGEGFDVAVSHTGSVAENYRVATELLFGNLVGRYVALADHRRLMRATRLPDRAFDRLILDTAVPIEHLVRKIQRREATPNTRAAHTRASEKRAEIRRLWTEGDGHTGDRSAWEAWQGLLQWIDHDGRASANGRVKSLYDGTLGRVKRKALRNALAYAGADDPQRHAMIAGDAPSLN